MASHDLNTLTAQLAIGEKPSTDAISPAKGTWASLPRELRRQILAVAVNEAVPLKPGNSTCAQEDDMRNFMAQFFRERSNADALIKEAKRQTLSLTQISHESCDDCLDAIKGVRAKVQRLSASAQSARANLGDTISMGRPNDIKKRNDIREEMSHLDAMERVLSWIAWLPGTRGLP